MNREDLAWAAGFFDGEGWVGAPTCKWGLRPLIVKIGQTSQPGSKDCPDTLIRFQKAVGGLGRLHGPIPPSPRQNRKRTLWNWDTGKFESAQAVVAMLWPFLSATKRAQAKAALELRRAGRPKGVFHCYVKGCGRFIREHGLCRDHLWAAMAHGDPEALTDLRGRSVKADRERDALRDEELSNVLVNVRAGNR